jgi:hypothetical protein
MRDSSHTVVQRAVRGWTVPLEFPFACLASFPLPSLPPPARPWCGALERRVVHPSARRGGGGTECSDAPRSSD